MGRAHNVTYSVVHHKARLLYRSVIGHLKIVGHKVVTNKYETIDVRSVTKRFRFLWDFSPKETGIQMEGKDFQGKSQVEELQNFPGERKICPLSE